jgi:hypothetical protein
MKGAMIVRSSMVLLFCGCLNDMVAQSLTFTAPQNFLPNAVTDKAIDITNFKGGFFVTWKESGVSGKVHVSYLGRYYDTTTAHKDGVVEKEQTCFNPVLRVLNDRLYLFWITPDGSVHYLINTADTSFDLAMVYSLVLSGNPKLAYGITSASIGGKMLLLAAHAADKSHLVYALIIPGQDGRLPPGSILTIPARTSADYPFVVGLNDSVARFCWRGAGKEQTVYTTDYNIRTDKWAVSVPLGHAQSKTAPAIYEVWNLKRLVYIWKGPNNDKKLYYATAADGAVPQSQTALPGYFATDIPISICNVDDNHFILAYSGQDGKLYLSYFANYNPASWMKDLLLPVKSTYTLRDIVLPGSHDAGMSVLSGVGGSQSGTINECNTLTQTLSIGGQLNAGIRMFDLRVGTFNGNLYMKHCSSDCMADAIGGGFGQKLSAALNEIRQFLQTNTDEIVLLTFSHFCEQETPVRELAEKILTGLGKELVYRRASGDIGTIPLKDMAGKVIVTFEHYSQSDGLIDSCTIDDESGAFINFRRKYAATNEIGKFLVKQESFFRALSKGTRSNDLVRLDWQLTQSSDEAAMACNDFQNEKTNPLVSGMMLLTNVIRKHQSIIDLSIDGNQYLPLNLNEWISRGIITPANKPNIIYVDAAGGWTTDYCIHLNSTDLYRKQ